ncbi:hypothetical protein LCGC14_1800030, partial [marine sediment metagenome]
MDARRLLWVVLVVALAIMAATLILPGVLSPPPESPPAPAATPAPATATAPTIAPRPASPAPTPATTAPATTAPATATATASAPAATWQYEGHPVREVLLGSVDERDGYAFQVQLTSLGAAVKTLKLASHFASLADKRRYESAPDAYPAAVAKDPKLLGNYSLLNPVIGQNGTYYPMATGWIYFPADGKEPNLTGSRWKPGKVVTDAEGTQSVTFTTTIKRNNKPYVRLEKTYVVRKRPPPAP